MLHTIMEDNLGNDGLNRGERLAVCFLFLSVALHTPKWNHLSIDIFLSPFFAVEYKFFVDFQNP